MSTQISPIISVAELQSLLQTKEEVLIFDVSNGKEAKENYEKKHLKNALFVDINSQLANIKENLAEGGRHPLPEIKDFAKVLGQLGISPATHVVVYDDKNGANAAARFWWMLKAVNHNKVQVLDGGLANAEKNNFPIDNEVVISKSVSDYPVEKWVLPQVTIETIDKVKEQNDYVIVDVREESRYSGLTEPIDLIAGHIPGAINIPFVNNLDENGLFLEKEKLQQVYNKVLDAVKPENVIIHCGSGVTACHTILAMHYAGFEFPNLYVGSWSEWSRNNKEMVLKH
ncbi:sulfurtransferase [Flavobacterium haoranii]|uniref:Thiosulfate/3-mercaptopyruvate sulfurtransferase n=1 Tax=Flavobacterium haoranii TaxID=683124 RepID=A0A1M6L8R0_9FLAO|nr:sulfurtransferase [Flavobacterium haoranii]SHJ67560.1 thiosulfate/3-mercaptopyruvate sulfurtransferase [Flavobacterium haoranii]